MASTKTKKPVPPGQSPELGEQIQNERRRVDFDSYDITVQQLVTMVGESQIDIAPTYQRRFRWDETRQSELVESIFLGIPLPNLFMATNPNGTWEVVDGLQRLSTLIHFCADDRIRRSLGFKDSLKLGELTKLTRLNGKKFESLPPTIKTQFMLRPIKVTTLNDKSDLKVRFDLFERLNTGGISLTPQEIRGCIYRGRFNDFLEEMSKDRNFRKVVALRKTQEMDGTREEYALRFFAFKDGYQTFEHSVIGFLNDYMAAATKRFDYKNQEALFKQTFAELAKIFPDGIHRGTKFAPVNLYEAISVGAALALEQNGTLVTQSNPVKWAASEELRAMTTVSTNEPRFVVGRIEFAAKKFGWS